MKTLPSRSARSASIAILLTTAALAGCNSVDRVNGYRPQAPSFVQADYQWVDEGWINRTQPDGHPAVKLTWELPENFSGQSFNVYSAAAGDSRYILSATVTSCSNGICEYLDRDVEPGGTYDYYVATLDERTGEEAASGAVEVTVPSNSVPAQPPAPEAVALDGAVFLHWPDQGAQRYRVFLEGIDGDSVFYEIGATDGQGYVDSRAENGHRFAYAIAAVDTLGRPGARSPLVGVVPRPDYHADLLYPVSANADSSGFRFQTSEATSPIVPGGSVSAQWRLERSGGALSIVPVNGSAVTQGQFTTALACGPGSEVDCEAVTTAPSSTSFGTSAVPVVAGDTYVFRVAGDDGQTHYAKIRVTGWSSEGGEPTALVFDWAYQLLPNEPSLTRLHR